MPRVGILLRFFNPGAGVLHRKAVPGAGILTKKKVAWQSVRGRGGGMVTGQIDTSIMMWLQKHNTVHITFRREDINENPNSCKYI